MKEIDRLEALRKEATQGEWKMATRIENHSVGWRSDEVLVNEINNDIVAKNANAEYIAATHNSLPSIIQDYKAMKEALEFYVKDLGYDDGGEYAQQVLDKIDDKKEVAND